ncbi:hypothetical protein V1477_004737 [Vespula maculifrons]|uniref:Uncharacterized protein n=1 Tax=Vespula maculifrons TaxID=7453 RepID=A0ABD2CMN8_VESMC
MNMGCLERKHKRPIQHTDATLTSCITYVIIRVNVSHIPRLCDILTSWNIFVVNLGIKFVPQNVIAVEIQVLVTLAFYIIMHN